VRAWTDRLATRDRLLAALPDTLEQEWAASYESLCHNAELPAFQQGLVHANPDLFLALRKWLDTGRPPQRQTVLRLASYLARSAAKTSPYSTFTGSGLAAWGDGEVEPDPRAPQTTTTEISVGSLHRIARALCERPEFLEGCPVRVNPSATVRDDTVIFLGRRPAEQVHTLALTPIVRRVFELVTPGITLGELRNGLAAGAASARQVDVFVRRLVAVGLVELVLPLADQAPDPVADLAAWLRRHRWHGLERLDRTLGGLHEALVSYPTIGSPDDRVAVRDAVVRGLDAALREVGEHSHERNPKLAREFARYSFYENAVFPGTAAVLDRRRWQPVLDDLDAVRTLLGLLGPDLPVKLALSSFFQSRYPADARVPLLAFYRDVLAVQAVGPSSDPAVWQLRLAHHRFATEDSPVEAVRELHRLRAAVKRLLGERTPDVDGVVRIDPDELRALAREWPEWVRTPTSIGVYCQLAETGDRPELVVNMVSCGFGRGRNRVRQILDAVDLGGDAPSEPGPAEGHDGVLFAEFEAVARSAVNVRHPGVGLVVDYPGVRSVREESDRVPVNDLYVRRGENGLLQLVSERLHRPICPVHPGLAADRLLPPAARFMIEAFGEANTWFGPHSELRITTELRDDGGVRRLPRLMVGDVVLRRAMWLTRADRLPRRADAASDAAWLQDIAGWLATHGIPDRCFITVLDPATLAHRNEAQGTGNDTKPNYLDFASLLLLLAAERRLAAPDAMVQITEVLPETGQVRGEHVTEYIVELNEPGVTHA
jgi:hypothetical protein